MITLSITKGEYGKSIPVNCRQEPPRYAPNLIAQFEVRLSCKLYERDYDIVAEEIRPAIVHHLVKHKLLHPLLLPKLHEQHEKSMRDSSQVFPILMTRGDSDYWQAVAAHLSRGRIPANFEIYIEWQLRDFDDDAWSPLRDLPPPVSRQQPALEAWKAPRGPGWHEPIMPTIDPEGKYQKIDVMSYVGMGHVLPPWATYPPDKARFIWSRIGEENRNKLPDGYYEIEEELRHEKSLLDYLGQTVKIGWDVVDVIGVDRVRGMTFGFSRKDENSDRFICHQIKQFTPSNTMLPIEHHQLPHLGLKPAQSDSIGLPIRLPPPDFRKCGFFPKPSCPGCRICKRQ